MRLFQKRPVISVLGQILKIICNISNEILPIMYLIVKRNVLKIMSSTKCSGLTYNKFAKYFSILCISKKN